MIIGAHKAGTSSLSYYLSQHPDIFMPLLKEARFFAYDQNNPDHRRKVPQVFPVATLEEYERLFDGVKKERAIGEATPEYLCSPIAATYIKKHIPQAKLIAILRNPIDRAYSGYQMEVRSKRLQGPLPPKSFNENERWIKTSFYFNNLKRYFDNFSSSQIQVFIFEDMVSDVLGTVKEIFQFLEVDDAFVPSITVKNSGGVIKHKQLHKLLRDRRSFRIIKPFIPYRLRTIVHNLRNKCREKAPPLPKEMREQLAELYRADIERLEELLNKDLSIWRK